MVLVEATAAGLSSFFSFSSSAAAATTTAAASAHPLADYLR